MRLFLFLMFGVMWQVEAYIPSSKMILDRVTENALKMPLYVEQEVTIVSGDQSVTLKEHWLFDSDSSVRLIVKGEKDLKNQIAFQNLYTENQKTTTLSGILQSSRKPKPLLEKIFFIKSSDGLAKFLIQQGIVGEEINNSNNFKKITQGSNVKFQYQPEAFLRLGRLGGGVSYIMGYPPKVEGSTAALWIEQDQFNILKIRNAQGEELRADRPTVFSRGARWPKDMSYSWGSSGSSSQAQVQPDVVRMAESPQRQVFQKHVDARSSDFERHRGRYLIEEFYQKFR